MRSPLYANEVVFYPLENCLMAHLYEQRALMARLAGFMGARSWEWEFLGAGTEFSEYGESGEYGGGVKLFGVGASGEYGEASYGASASQNAIYRRHKTSLRSRISHAELAELIEREGLNICELPPSFSVKVADYCRGVKAGTTEDELVAESSRSDFSAFEREFGGGIGFGDFGISGHKAVASLFGSAEYRIVRMFWKRRFSGRLG